MSSCAQSDFTCSLDAARCSSLLQLIVLSGKGSGGEEEGERAGGRGIRLRVWPQSSITTRESHQEEAQLCTALLNLCILCPGPQPFRT